MKIKIKKKTYEEVMSYPKMKHKNPRKPTPFLVHLISFLSKKELKATNFHYELHGMKELPKTPALILMNHSSFIDLKIASRIFSSRPYNIVSTEDAFVGKKWFMRHIGCIPTKKFISDIMLVKDIKYALTKLKTNVLMYPEAGYTFDGTKTVLPDSLAKLIKMLNVPVITVITHGAFTRDPLYNNLQLRKTDVKADVSLLFQEGETIDLSLSEIKERLDMAFSFDQFKYQLDNHIRVKESFRADGLERILYKCPYCGTEGKMIGKGIKITCEACGKVHILNELGQLDGANFVAKYPHIPDWFLYERQAVAEAVLKKEYKEVYEVSIYMIRNEKAFYSVGDGVLVHDMDGLHLDSNDSEIHYHLPPNISYTLNVDYFFYELGDVISFGDTEKLFYCFPKDQRRPVCKARFASEEMYKLMNKR